MNSLDKLRNNSILRNSNNKSSEIVVHNSTTEILNKVKNDALLIAKQNPSLLNKGLELIFILDASSSCRGLEEATINGFNNLIANEMIKSNYTKVTLSLIRDFPNSCIFRKDIINVPCLSYEAYGATALYDTLCETILDVRADRTKSGIIPSKTMVAIMTDGEENSSSRYSLSSTRDLIRLCQSEGWEFVFLGAFKNSKMTASELGITHKAETSNNEITMEKSFEAIEKAIDDLRENNMISSSWADEVDNEVLRLEQKRTRKK